MKSFTSFFAALILTMTAIAQVESAEIGPHHIQSVSYDSVRNRANILLDNGYKFVFAPEIEDEYLLDEFEKNFYAGRKVSIDTNDQNPSYTLSTTEVDEDGDEYREDLVVFISGETKKALPTIEEIEKISSDQYLIELSDGSKWKSNTNSSHRIEKWYGGQKVMIVKNDGSDIGEETMLINIQAKYADLSVFTTDSSIFGYVNYWDYRAAFVESFTAE